MSKGLSWRQRGMLTSIARNTKRNVGTEHEPVAWRDIDYGPTSAGGDDYFTARVQWNIEQAMRRSLRSLERRGLVELGRYSFSPEAETRGISPHIVWNYAHPDDHVPGEARIMTGVLLTDAGWAVVEEEKAKRKGEAR